jgi:hypothetical protein
LEVTVNVARDHSAAQQNDTSDTCSPDCVGAGGHSERVPAELLAEDTEKTPNVGTNLHALVRSYLRLMPPVLLALAALLGAISQIVR